MPSETYGREPSPLGLGCGGLVARLSIGGRIGRRRRRGRQRNGRRVGFVLVVSVRIAGVIGAALLEGRCHRRDFWISCLVRTRVVVHDVTPTVPPIRREKRGDLNVGTETQFRRGSGPDTDSLPQAAAQPIPSLLIDRAAREQVRRLLAKVGPLNRVRLLGEYRNEHIGG